MYSERLERLDTQYLVETAEGIELQAQLAGPVPRALAYLIDVSIRTLVVMLLSLPLMFAGKFGTGLMLILTFLLEWFYPVVFEVFRHGQTPGKKCLQIAVVNDDLTPISWGTSIIRNLVRFADFLPFAYLAGLISMVLNGNFQRLGDLAAGTLVIHRSQSDEPFSLPQASPQTPPLPLDLEEQMAIVGFAERHQQLSDERQQELAEILQAITQRRGQEAVTYLRGIGAWLLGAR